MDSEGFTFFLQCVAWLSSLVDLAIGVVAFVRLRTTPAGLLIGGGFTLMSLFGVSLRILRMVMKPDLDAPDVDFDAWLMQIEAISTVNTCGVMLFMLAIGIGFLLLPKSLEKLAAGDAPTE